MQKNEEIDKILIEESWSNFEQKNEIYTDKELEKSDISSMMIHNDYFNELLRSYVISAERNLKNKLIYKDIFFIFCIAIMLIVVFAFFRNDPICYHSSK